MNDISDEPTQPPAPPPVDGPAKLVWIELTKNSDRIAALTRRVGTLEIKRDALSDRIASASEIGRAHV